MNWTYINDHFVEEDKAVINVRDLSVQRGYGVFDFFRIRDNKPLFLDDYLTRFFNSASELFITLPLSGQQLKEVIYTLISRNNIPHSGIRITATGGYSPDGYTPARGNLIIQQQPLIPVSAEKKEYGIKIITHEYMRDLPAVKSINYVMGVWLQRLVKEKQADDVLYVKNNLVTEFPRANIFMVSREGKLLTPASNVLAGITRKKVLTLAPEILPVATTAIALHELKNAAEVFMTSTTKCILPIVEIDGIKINDGRPGAITKALSALFSEMEERVIKQTAE